MIRFCAPKKSYILYEKLNKEILADYFVGDNSDETIYLSDVSGKYLGSIESSCLSCGSNICNIIVEDCVELNKDMWMNVRQYFSGYRNHSHEHILLPIVDKLGRLRYLAYEDEDANREIRMLRELLELQGALQFSDIYTEYKCVKIYEFNELAYFFAQYLKKQDIEVQVYGEIWSNFYSESECCRPEHECLTIYAEGVGEKDSNWKKNLLKSVSVEFECIDAIYESNIKKGFIQDAKQDYLALFEYLRNKEVIILGTGREEQDAYNLLIEYGIDICCFACMEYDKESHKMFGKEIINEVDVRKKYKNPIFIDCISQYSSWGMGKVDYYDYMGYKRNERFVLLKDYIKIPSDSLISLLKRNKFVLVGDVYLCRRLAMYLKDNNILPVGYLPAFWDDKGEWDIKKLSIENIDKEMMCLIIVPEFSACYSGQKHKIINFLKENGIDNYTDYFSYTVSFITIEERSAVKYRNQNLIPQRIIHGSIGGFNGNIFFRGILDNHPDILMISDYGYLNNALFWICVRLSSVKSENILSLFWKLHNEEGWYAIDIDNVDAFNAEMETLLADGNEFTSQELFVMIHIAYMSMWKENMPEIKNAVIYWEPHETLRVVGEEWRRWLAADTVPCDIVNVVRNISIRNGSAIKNLLRSGQSKTAYDIFLRGLSCPPIGKKESIQSSRLVIKFEDLKLNPAKTLSELCKKWNIQWADSFMETTRRGELYKYNNGERLVSGFDLQPVYHIYDEYFSVYDIFRITLFNALWQKKYGYSYVRILDFSRRELQAIFSQNFRFEKFIEFKDEKAELDFKIELQQIIRRDLQKKRRCEFFSEDSCYTDLMVELDRLSYYSEDVRFC